MSNYSKETEVWKDVVDFEGIYQVSSIGRLKSLDRLTSDGRKIKGRIRKLKKNNRGYVTASLWKENREYTRLIHRLVAESFIANEDRLEQVNHINEDKNNNSAANLEWCSNEYNFNHGTRAERTTKHKNYINRERPTYEGKRVKATCTKTGLVIYLENMRKGEDYGFDFRSISSVCRGKQKTHRGFEFEYA